MPVQGQDVIGLYIWGNMCGIIYYNVTRNSYSGFGSSVDCLARVYGYFRSFLRSQDPFPVRDPLPVG